ncbi:hypothetical protein ACXAT3_002755 [Clostridium sporogenes]
MRKLIRKSLINTAIITLVGGLFLYMNGIIGIANTIIESEDNCKENGYYYMCTTTDQNNKVWIDMGKSYKGDKFIYIKPSKNNTVVKLFSIQ